MTLEGPRVRVRAGYEFASGRHHPRSKASCRTNSHSEKFNHWTKMGNTYASCFQSMQGDTGKPSVPGKCTTRNHRTSPRLSVEPKARFRYISDWSEYERTGKAWERGYSLASQPQHRSVLGTSLCMGTRLPGRPE